MARDAGFAKAVAAEARDLGLEVIVTDGTRSIADTVRLVEKHFGLVEEQPSSTTRKPPTHEL